MKKMILMAAMAVMMTGATALAATPERAADCRDYAPCREVSYECCGDGYHGGHRRGGRGGCWNDDRGGYGCYRGGYDNNER